MKQFYLTKKIYSVVTTVLVLLGLREESVGTSTAIRTSAINFNARNVFGIYSLKAALAFLLFASLGVSAQTTLIDPAGDGGFNNGTTFASNGWTVANYASSTNAWATGTAVSTAPFSGRSAYISQDGGTTSTYSLTSSNHVYFYRDVAIPAGSVYIPLSFTWLANGESTWDAIQVFVAPTTVTPVAGLHPGSGLTLVPSDITGATQLGNGLNLVTTPQTASVVVPNSFAGQTVRLIFMWKSDTSGGTAPPGAIDNISLIASPTFPSYTANANGGLWSSAATWAGGVVPTAGNVTIPAGTIVTVDQALSLNNLTINGTVQWNGSSNAMTLSGNLLINSGGSFLPYTTGGTGQTINIAGNFQNDGYTNLALTSTVLNFNGSGSSLSGGGLFEGDGTNGIIRALSFQNTGSNSISTSQSLIVTSGMTHTAGSLNTGGKLRIDNTAQIYGRTINKSVASLAVTAMGSAYNAAPVVFGTAVTQWTNAGASAIGTRYVSGVNVYVGTSTAGLGTVAPTHTSGTGGTNNNLLWLGTTGTLGNPYPYNLASTVGTQYFYGDNLYVATVANAIAANNVAGAPVHTSGIVNGYLYIGTVAKASANYDATSQTVRSLNLVSAGNGYSSAPAIAFSVGVAGGTGSGAAATAVFLQQVAGPSSFLFQKSGGAATISGGLDINSDAGTSVLAPANEQASSGVAALSTSGGGVNYTVAPQIGFAGPTALNLIINPGSGYTAAPTITVSGGTLIAGSAYTSSSFTIAVNAGKVQAVYLTSTSAVYSVPPTLTLSAPGAGTTATLAFPAGCWPAATANIGTNGQLTSFTVTNSGYGYVTAPATILGATSGTPEGGTFTTAATAPSTRIALYNLTLSNFTPSPAPVAQGEDVAIPANRKISSLSLGGFSAGLNVTGNLILFGSSSPLSLTASGNAPGSVINLGGNNLLFTWNGYGGASSTFGSTNAYIKNGSMTVIGRGGGSTFTFPFSGTFTWKADTGSTASTGSSVTRVTVSDTAAPTNATQGTSFPIGGRAFRVQYSNIGTGGFATLPTPGPTPQVTLSFNSDDALTAYTQDVLLVSDSNSLSGPWSFKSVGSGSGAITSATTGSRTTATAAPGPIVPTGNDYYAWSVSAPTITNFSPLTVCANAGTFTITGTNLTGVTNLQIGGVPVTSFTVVSATQITGVAGATTTGFVTFQKAGNTITGSQTVTVAPSPSAPSASPATATVNLGGSPNVTASGAGGTFNWYAAASGGSPLFTGATYALPVCSSTTVYVAENSGSCEGPRTAVPITVLPTTITASTPQFCGSGGDSTLTATPSDPTILYSWTTNGAVTFNQTTGESVIASVVSTADVTVTATKGSCTATKTISLSVYPLPNANVTTTATGVCPGTSATINSGLSSDAFSATCITPVSTLSTAPGTAVTLINGSGVQTTTGANSTTNIDDNYWSVPIGFTFNYLGTNYTSVYVSTNGMVTFTAGTTAFSFPSGFPSTSSPAAAVAVCARDMYFTSGSTAALKYWVEGTAPNRRFVVQYANVLSYDTRAASGASIGTNSAEAVFYETVGNVDIRVINSNNGSGTVPGNSTNKLIGLQNAQQTVGAVAPRCSPATPNYWNAVTTEILAPQAWRFSPPANYSVTWSTVGAGNVLTPVQTGTNIFSLTVSPAVTTTYDLRYTNQFTGCTNIADSDRVTMTIINNVAPSTTAVSNVPSVCLGGSANLSLTGNVNSIGNTDGLTYQWQISTDGGSTWTDISAATAATLTVTPTVASSYQALVKVCNGSAVASSPVSIGFTNTVATTTPATRCGTGTVVLAATTASSGATLNWYAAASGGTALGTGSSFTTPTISGTTTYYVAAETTGPACSSPRVAVVATVTTAPTINLTGGSSTSICTGSTATLTTDANANYDTFSIVPAATASYIGGGQFSFNPTATTTYTVTASQSTGSLCATTFTYTVNVNSTNVTPAASASTICLGQSVTLSATTLGLSTGPQSLPGTYCTADSSGGGGSNPITSVQFGTINNSTPTQTSPYSYTFPATGSTTTTVAAGQTYPLTVAASTSIASLWIDYNRNGTFEASEWTQLWTSANSGTVNITIPSNAVAGWTAMRIRSRGSGNTNGSGDACTAFFSGTSQDYTINVIGVADVTSSTNYSWAIGATNIGSGSSLNYTPTTLGATTYTVTATDPATTCSATANITVTTQNTSASINTPPAAQTKCLGSTATFTVAATGVNLTYQWRKGTTNLTNGGAISGATTATLTITGLVAGDAGDYNVVVGSDCGSPVTSADAHLTIVTPLASINASATTVCSGTSVTLTENGGSATSWSWTPGGATSSAITVTPATTTTYVVTATTQVTGCTATASVTINVNETPSAISVVPVNSTVCSGATVQVNASGGSFTSTYFADSFDALSSNFAAATVSGTTTTTATLNTTYQAQGSGSVLFNTDGVSSVATYSLNSNVNLTGASTANLTFSHITDFEGPSTSYDYGYVEYSSDGGANWTTFQTTNYTGSADAAVFSGTDVRFSTKSYPEWISAFTGAGIQPTNALWKNETFTIPAAALTNQFRIRFRYTTDISTNYVGWFIDNVKVSANGNTQYAWTATPATTLYKDAALTQVYNVGTDFAPTVYAQPTAATQFNVSVANGPCSNSNSATVNVNPLPVITLANSVTTCNGAGTDITIPENNNTYSWAPSTGVTVVNVQTVHVDPPTTTTYTVTTTNTTTFCQSTKQITVNVNDPGSIVTQPADRIVAQGFSTSFSVAGTNGITYGYQWQIKTGPSTYANLSNGAQYSGVTTSVLTVNNAGTGTAVDGTLYRVLLTPPAPCANLISNDAILTVSTTGIASSPSDVNICLPTPSTAQFAVTTNGDEPYYVEWQVSTDNGATYTTIDLVDVDNTFLYTGPNTTAVPGLTFEYPADSNNPTGADFKVLNVSGISSVMTLKFKAIVNEVLPSAVATLTVTAPASFTSNLSTTEVIRCKNPVPGTATNLSVTTAGDVTSVQWRYDTTPGGSFTNVVTNNTPAGATYVASSAANNYLLAVTTNGSTPAGSYYYKAFVVGSAACGSTPLQSNTATITVANPIVSIASSSASYCSPGAAVSLTASGASTYSWTSTPSGFTSSSSSVSVTPTAATTYSVIGTDANGCTNSATVAVGVGTSFTLAASAAPTTVCPNTAVTLTAVPTAASGNTYLINTVPYQFAAVSGTFTPLSGTTVSSGLTTDDDTMSATLTPGSGFTFNYGGTNYTNFRVSSNGQLVFGTAGTQTATNDLASTTSTYRPGLAPLWDDTQLTAGINYQISGTAPNRVLTIEWLNMEWNYTSTTAVISYQVKLYETTNVIEYVYRQESTAYTPGTTGGASIGLMGTAGSNFLSLQDTSASPALSTSTAKNDITTKPATGQIYRFTPTTPITYTYAWSSTPSGFTGTGASTTANPAVSTTYAVNATSNQGCTASATTSVSVDSTPPTYTTTTPANRTLCSGTAVSFAVSATSATPLTYQWKKNGVNIPSATSATLSGTTTSAVSTPSNFTSGTYTVDIIGCTTVTATFNLTVNPLPTATISGTASVCQNGTSPVVTFTGATGTSPYTFTYTVTGTSGNQTVTTTSGNSIAVNAPTTTSGTFAYTLVSVQDANTCSQTQAGTANVIVNPLPTAPTLASNAPVCAGNTLNLTATVAPLSGYTLNNNSGVAFIDISSTGTAVPTPAVSDDSEHNLTIPSFTFNGVAYTTARVGNNGVLVFGTTTGDIIYNNSALPQGIAASTSSTTGIITGTGNSLAAICANWDDMTTSSTVTTSIKTQTVGTKYIIQWTNEDNFNATGTGTITFQIQLDSSNGKIHLVYPDITYGAAGYDGGGSATIGLNYSATSALQYSFNTASLVDGQSLTFTPAAYTYAWTGPNSFTSSVQNPSIANATVAASGNYTLQITNGNGCSSSSSVNAVVGPQPQWYLDADGDHYYTGTAISSCTSPGAGYTTTGLLGGGDCDDSVATTNPGAPEICYNNVDDNCNGLKSEGCAPVVVNMNPSYDNTVMASIATAIPALPYTYSGATDLKFRFSITNLTTGVTAPDIIQTSRFVIIPGSIRDYNVQYSIKASAVINDEVVPFYGNTITVFSPVVQKVTLSSASCGATLASLSSTITANAGLNATGYTFRIRVNDANPSPTYAYSSSSTRFISANTFSGFPLQYSSSYKVAVSYTFVDPVTSQSVESGYGAECTVNTPSIPVTTMSAPTCGSTASSLTASMSATAAPYATAYQFRIRLFADNGPNPTYYTTPVLTSRFSNLAAFQAVTLQYNTDYAISVQYSVANGTGTLWSGYGPDCKVTTPFFPTTSLVASQCGLATATPLNQQLNITPYPGFPHYKVLLEEIVAGQETPVYVGEKEIVYSYFKLSEIPGAQLGKTYNISVSIKLNGVFGPYSSACDVHTPAPAKGDIAVPFKATAYPNPFANSFMLDIKSSSQSSVNLKVYDMVGRLIEQRDIRISDMATTSFGDKYPSGVYNIVVSQEDTVQTVRVVKR